MNEVPVDRFGYGLASGRKLSVDDADVSCRAWWKPHGSMGSAPPCGPNTSTDNDARFVTGTGYGGPADFLDNLRRGFVKLWEEGAMHNTGVTAERMLRIRLVNPNSDERVTAAMAAVARDSAPLGVCIEATTSSRAAPLITNARELAQAAEVLLDLFVAGLDPLDGVIVSAFGDPGVGVLRHRLQVPVTGIGEASLHEAATHGAFAICTTTPQLANAMREQAEALGLQDALVCVLTTREEPHKLMADAAALDAALAELVETAREEYRARAVIIGGGPLAPATLRLAPLSPVPLIEPVSAAVRRLCARRGRSDGPRTGQVRGTD